MSKGTGKPQPGCCPECSRLYGYTGIGMSQGTCAFGHAPEDHVTVGLQEIAQRLGAKRPAVDQWRTRDQLPDPLPYPVGGRPAWQWGTIRRWAIATGRYPSTSREKIMNERSRMAEELAERVRERLSAADGGWVPYADLLAMAPQGRRIEHDGDIPGSDIMGYDSAAGPAWDAGASGKPDGGMLANVLSAIERSLSGSPQRLDEGYPQGAGRAFRLIASPVRSEGDVIIIPQGMQHEGERAVLAERILDGGPDRWRAIISAPGSPCDREVIGIARGWAEEAEIAR